MHDPCLLLPLVVLPDTRASAVWHRDSRRSRTRTCGYVQGPSTLQCSRGWGKCTRGGRAMRGNSASATPTFMPHRNWCRLCRTSTCDKSPAVAPTLPTCLAPASSSTRSRSCCRIRYLRLSHHDSLLCVCIRTWSFGSDLRSTMYNRRLSHRGTDLQRRAIHVGKRKGWCLVCAVCALSVHMIPGTAT